MPNNNNPPAVSITQVVEGDIITYRNGVMAPVVGTKYDEDWMHPFSIYTPAQSNSYSESGETLESEWDIVGIDSSKRPLTIAEWASKNPDDANLLCCGLARVVRNQ